MIVARPNACTRMLAAIARRGASPCSRWRCTPPPIVETLAEVPIQGLNPVKPNIMFTMDDSGSMGWDFLPDYVAWVAPGIAHCRDGIQCGGATSQPGGGYTFSQYDPPVRSASYNGVYLRSVGRLPAGQEGGRHRSSLRRLGRHVRRRRGPASTSTASPAIRAPTPAAPSISPPAIRTSVWCWKSSATTAEKQTADANGSVCRRNGRAYTAVTVSGNTTPAIAAGYNYPNASVTCVGHREVQVRLRVRAQRQSVLLHDLAGPVLLGQGRRGLGHDALREPVGPDDVQVRSLRHGRGDLRSAGLHARRHQAVGVPRQRRRGGQSQRSHLRAGNGQLRQLVRVLPHADPVDESGVGHRVLRARPELARRLPHALGERHAVHERQGLHHREQADLVHQRLQGQPRTAARRCRMRCGASASSSPAISRARDCRARRTRSIP